MSRVTANNLLKDGLIFLKYPNENEIIWAQKRVQVNPIWLKEGSSEPHLATPLIK